VKCHAVFVGMWRFFENAISVSVLSKKMHRRMEFWFSSKCVVSYIDLLLTFWVEQHNPFVRRV